ncbi:hypothetical protein GUITHDRAFT_115574 [Guillardia theta CCMP2712]|uniref:non-specific serine/threonine protein kinase n=1 Tax=Guillardia theta (strain CCMP2712) TaxID=905079 RepID=L1IR75_GUITC|nr:hypothetical protein GUITHDRAFT_115574 [Guillardia theta CCMP2712]EKX38310.1 hypothetical protein GUITHDRAFT_115574 [Guillardia theta CCMP2712]|eukprot:XP_005825290.1 hypothetical protein GUITHDRAFT_115574 [Guillardia theta CCMP2712]
MYEHGFAYCPSKGVKYSSGGKTPYAQRRLKPGDVIACSLDCERREIRYLVNGEDLGVAFGEEEVTEEAVGEGLRFTVTLGPGQGVKLVKAEEEEEESEGRERAWEMLSFYYEGEWCYLRALDLELLSFAHVIVRLLVNNSQSQGLEVLRLMGENSSFLLYGSNSKEFQMTGSLIDTLLDEKVLSSTCLSHTKEVTVVEELIQNLEEVVGQGLKPWIQLIAHKLVRRRMYEHGFAYCPSKGVKYSSGGKTPYAQRRLKPGDVIACSLDCERREIRYLVNGEDLGVAFGEEEVTEEAVGEGLRFTQRSQQSSDDLSRNLKCCVSDFMLDDQVGLSFKQNFQKFFFELEFEAAEATMMIESRSSIFKASEVCLPLIPSLYIHMWYANKISQLSLVRIQLSDIPAEISILRLQSLDVSENRLNHLSPSLCLVVTLEILRCNNNFLSILPDDIGLLVNLIKLEAAQNALSSLPDSLFSLARLEDLDISGPPLPRERLCRNSTAELELDSFLGFFREVSCWEEIVGRSEQEEMFYRHAQEGVVARERLVDLEEEMLHKYWRYKGRRHESFSFDPAILTMRSLRRLSMRNVGIQGRLLIPRHVTTGSLEEVDLSYNQISDVSLTSQSLRGLKRFCLEGNRLLIPEEVKKRGEASVLNFLRGRAEASQESFKLMLFLHGLGGVGKTCLLAALKGKEFDPDGEMTDGIEISSWKVRVEEEEVQYLKQALTESQQNQVSQRLSRKRIEDLMGVEIEFVVHDFAGQEVYYNSHQLFLHNRALELVLWDVRRGFDNSGVCFWLNNIKTCAPRAAIIIVGTKTDEMDTPPLDLHALSQKFPQVKAFHAVSSKTMRGVEDLRRLLVKQALLEEHVGQSIPHKWSILEDIIVQEARSSKTGYVRFPTLREWARLSAFSSDDAIEDAADFLHDIGTIVRFSDEDARLTGLDDVVITDKQWLADVMSSIITSKSRVHVLSHADLSSMWQAFPPDVHSNLIDLLKKFDLLVETDSRSFLVPCLLPLGAPRGEDLEAFTLIPGERLSLSYRTFALSFCPYGFFNLLQARLRDLDASRFPWCRVGMWRNGMPIASSYHSRGVVILHQEENKVECTFSGEGKDNLISVVSESIFILLTDKYQVTYDVFLPCQGCLDVCPRAPHMFSSNVTLKRAMQKHQIFLQCHKEFHNIPVAHYLAAMPHSSRVSQEQLSSVLEGIGLWKATHRAHVYLSYARGDEEALRAGLRVKALLLEQLIDVWFPTHDSPDAVRANELALSSATIVIALITKRYCLPHGLGLKEIQYAVEVKPKPVIPVVVEDESPSFPLAWMTSSVGLHLCGLLYVDLRARDEEQFSLVARRTQALLAASGVRGGRSSEHFDFMISYSWSNCDNGEEAGEEGDTRREFWSPRRIKRALEESAGSGKQLRGWIDVEQLGNRPREGLYEGIRRGLTESQVLVVCMSNEYAMSRNCSMECRYALLLNKPVLLALVGSDDNSPLPPAWKSTETGLLTSHLWSEISKQEELFFDFRRVRSKSQFDAIISSLKRKIEEMQRNDQEASETRAGQETSPTTIDLSDSVEEQMKFGRRMAIQFFRSHSSFGSTFPVLWVIQWQPKAQDTLTAFDAWEDNDYFLRPVSETPDAWVLVPRARFRIDDARHRIKSLSSLLFLVVRCLAVLQQGVLCSLSKVEDSKGETSAMKKFLRYEELEVFLEGSSKGMVGRAEAIRESLQLIHNLVKSDDSWSSSSSELKLEVLPSKEVFWSFWSKDLVRDTIDADWLVEWTRRSNQLEEGGRRSRPRGVTLDEQVMMAETSVVPSDVTDDQSNIKRLKQILSRQELLLSKFPQTSIK